MTRFLTLFRLPSRKPWDDLADLIQMAHTKESDVTDDVIARAKALYVERACSLGFKKFTPWRLLSANLKQEWIHRAKVATEEPVPFPPYAADILNQARSIVSGERQTTNGAPERSLEMLAAMWTAYLGVEVTATDAGLMLAQLKMVRAKTGVTKDDHFVDGAGYFALAGEMAARANNGTP